MGDHAIATSDSEKDIESTATGGSSDKVSPQSDGKLYLKDSLQFLRLTWPLLLGNTLEWYEFGVYSYVETEIADNFFEGSSLGAGLCSDFCC